MADLKKKNNDVLFGTVNDERGDTGPAEDLEVEVYIKVKFRIQTWDGVTKEHEADLPAHVPIRHLKEELENELGDAALSDWIIHSNGVRMVDDNCIHNVYKLEHGERIDVFVHNPLSTRI